MEDSSQEPAAPLEGDGKANDRSSRIVIIGVIAAVFLGVFLAKAWNGRDAALVATGTSITSVRNDAMADFEAARRSGKPTYVLFHSLT